jgi:hypothetical protein
MYIIYQYNEDGSKCPISSYSQNTKSYDEILSIIQTLDQNKTYSIEFQSELGTTVLY